jgi:hypothetical protein
VNLADRELRKVLVAVEATEAGRAVDRIGDGVPVGDAVRIRDLRGQDVLHGPGEVVAEALSHRTFVAAAESRDLVVLNRMPVLVDEDVGDLGVVDTAGSGRHLERPGAVEGVVRRRPIDDDGLNRLLTFVNPSD